MISQLIQVNGHDSNKATFEFGFTGTRNGMTELQKEIVASILCNFQGTFHHGLCIGADVEAHDIATFLGYRTVGHPPVNKEYMGQRECSIMMQAKPYYVRNKEIVLASQIVIATPKSKQETGGTWQTINYARKLIEGGMQKQCYIIMPNGEVGTVQFIPDSSLHGKVLKTELN